jgi:hypothetical protein
VAGVVALGVLAAGGALLLSPEGPSGPPPPPALADAVPFDGRSPREPAAEGTRVLVALPRPALGDTGIAEPSAQRRYVRSLREESASLRSALSARGIPLGQVVTFERTWNGFGATVRTRDLARLDSLGVRVRPVRRFYPALGEPARLPGVAVAGAPAEVGGVPVALLASGVDAAHPLLAERLDAGPDVVDGDDDPAPAQDPRGGRRESSGTALAGVLVAAGERVLPIRVAGLQPAAQGTGLEEVALSDQLLAGLERAVDPDGDGATDDHAGVALVGVNAPYAGFGDSAEVRAVRAAAALGTLVVAPAGGEGAGAGAQGTVGSPGAAPAALTAGALAAPAAPARVDLTIGDEGAPGAALLAGAPPPDGLRTGVTRAAAGALTGGMRARGRIAVVEAGNAPAAAAAEAAAAGARAVLLAEPRRRRPLPAMPAGRFGIPVLGVTGAAAGAVLAASDGQEVDVGEPRPGRTIPAPPSDAPLAVSPFSSRGPAASGTLKPDLAAPGAVLTAIPGGGAKTIEGAGAEGGGFEGAGAQGGGTEGAGGEGGGTGGAAGESGGGGGAGAVVGGTAIAAAAVAVEAARLARARPDATPAQLRASLMAAAQGAGPVRGAGAGVLRAPAAGAALTAATSDPRRGDPCPGGQPCVRVVIANRAVSDAELDLGVAADPGTTATVAPAHLVVPAGARREAKVAVFAAPADGLASGRLEARLAGQVVLTHPLALALGEREPPVLGPLALQRRGRRVTGVRFATGAFELGDPLEEGTTLRLTARLDLSLVAPAGNRLVERLTPFAGARELLPAEYVYRLPRKTLRQLAPGRYAFRATARAPDGGTPAVAQSEPFRP